MFERFRAGTADKSPLTIAGDQRGVLCLHGITGTPFEVRPLAEAFGRLGCSVEAPLLAGHGGTLGELARAPEQTLIERFGPNHGRELRRRAHFEHDGQVSEERKVVSESRERTFDSDIRDPELLREALARMASELCASLSAHENHGRTIGIKVRLDDFSTVTRVRTLPAPTCDAEQVTRVALALLEEYAPARPVRLLGVRVAGLAGRGTPSQTQALGTTAGQLELPV